MMIPSNYEMNISYGGQHWAKVEFGHDTVLESVERKAHQIRRSLVCYGRASEEVAISIVEDRMCWL